MKIEEIKSWSELIELAEEEKVNIVIDRNENMQIHIAK